MEVADADGVDVAESDPGHLGHGPRPDAADAQEELLEARRLAEAIQPSAERGRTAQRVGPAPLDPESGCPAAQYERAYLHHLVKSGETLGAMLLSYANVQFYQELMARARAAIEKGQLASFIEEVQRRYAKSDETNGDG